MDPKTDIQQLLRLKRYETPPSGFHEDFLREFRRRQRIDLTQRTLRPSIRQIMAERIFFFLSSMQEASLRGPFMAYASIAAVGIVVSVAIWHHTPMGISKQSMTSSLSSHSYNFENASIIPPVEIPSQRTVGTLPPSYVLENQPASYEVPLSF